MTKIIQSNDQTPKYLNEQLPYLEDAVLTTGIDNVLVGDVIEFNYDGTPRTVFVLNPNYKLHMHGISLNQIDHQTLSTEIIDRMQAKDTPYAFYNRVVTSSKIAATDSYRTYDIRKLSAVKIRKYNTKKHFIINWTKPD